MCRLAGFVGGMLATFPVIAEPATGAAAPQADPFADLDFVLPDAGADDAAGPQHEAGPRAARVSLGHEVSFRTQADAGVVNNRSFARLEYARLVYGEQLYAQLDTKLNVYWASDHRAQAEDVASLLETNTQDAFLQYSATGGKTSFKAGIQRLIWGESEAGAITDEVSPRNFSELFFIPLEESRIGQLMFNIDRFSDIGNWSAFFVPRPRFNKYAKPGTAYYVDPFGGRADYHDEVSDKSLGEYGLRWKKTFGRSDVSFMAASLIDNDYALRLDSVSADGRAQVTRLKQRFTLTGMTFNYASGKYLIKGEVGLKMPRAFNDAAFQVQTRNVGDASLGVTYSLGQSNTLGVEVVNSHVVEWDAGLAGVSRNTRSFVLNNTFFFFNETLSINWLGVVTEPYTSYQTSFRTSYKWDDNTTLGIDLHIIDVPDQRSPLYVHRDQDQIFFKFQYQF